MIVNNKGKLATPHRSCCYFFLSFLFKLAFFGWPIPWCVKVSFYTDHNENGTLALPLTPSLYLPPFHWVGLTNLNFGKTKNKGFIVQYECFLAVSLLLQRIQEGKS